MPTPLTAPSKNSAQPAKAYTQVRVIGDRLARDYEANEIQTIQDERRRAVASGVYAHGGIIRELGGMVLPARQGIHTADILAVASYRPSEVAAIRGTEQYTLRVVATPGAPSRAVIAWHSDGTDAAPVNLFTVLASDPLDGSVAYAFGTQGVHLAFVHANPAQAFQLGDTWLVSTVHGRQLPSISERPWEAGDPGVSGVTLILTLPAVDVSVRGDVFTVPATTLLAATYAEITTVFVEALEYIRTSLDDPGFADDLSTNPTAERLQMVCAFRLTDSSADPLPEAALARTVIAAYVRPALASTLQRVQGHAYTIPLNQLPGQLGPDSLQQINLNEELTGELALRDNEVFGSYVVSGLGVSPSTNPAPVGMVAVMVEAGVARVNGLRISVPQPTEVLLEGPTDTGTVTNETKTYHTGTLDYYLNQSLHFPDGLPIAAIASLVADSVAKDANPVRGSGATDALDGTLAAISLVTGAVVVGVADSTIIRVVTGETHPTTGAVAPGATSIILNSATLFYNGAGQVRLSPGDPDLEEVVNYSSRNSTTLLGVTGVQFAHPVSTEVEQENFRMFGNSIQWQETDADAPGGQFHGQRPDVGIAYTVHYQVSLALAEGSGGDFTLVDNDGDGAFDAIRFTVGGVKPTNGTTFGVDYAFYLPRKDIIYLRQDGLIASQPGISAKVPHVRTPPGQFLELAKVIVAPPPAPLTVHETDIQAMSMRDLCGMARTLVDLRHDFVQQKLLDQIIGYDPSFDVADAESFADDSRVDWGFASFGGVGGDDTDMVTCNPGLNIVAEATTLGGGHLRLPRAVYEFPLTPNQTLKPIDKPGMVPLQNWFCLPYTDEPVLVQELRSESRNTNSFFAFSPPDPRIILTPSEDFWVHTTTHIDVLLGSLTFELSAETFATAQAKRIPKHQPFAPGRRVKFDWLMERIELIPDIYMREIVLTVRGYHFQSSGSGSEQVSAMFAGKPVVLRGIEGTISGPNGTVFVAPDLYEGGTNPLLQRRGGYFTAQFTVPAGVPCGNQMLVVTGTGMFGSDPPSVAKDLFTSFGVERAIHNIYRATILASPLSQTFAFPLDYFLTKAEVPFADKYRVVTQVDLEYDRGPDNEIQYDAHGVALTKEVDAYGRRLGERIPVGQGTLGPENDPLVFEVRDVVYPGGFPGLNYLEQVQKTWDEIDVDGAVTEFRFPDLVSQPAEKFLAVTFRNVGTEYQVHTATLGRTDQFGNVITSNPNRRPGTDTNLAGVVLDSLNNLNWESPDPDVQGSKIALNWALYRAKFDGTEAYLYFDTVTFPDDGAGILFLVTQEFTQEETALIWEVSTDQNAVTWREIVPFRELLLSAPTLVAHIRCRASSDVDRRSPLVAIANCTLVGFMPQAVGEYVQRVHVSETLEGADDVTGTIFVEQLPQGEPPVIYMSNGESSGGRPIWEECGAGSDLVVRSQTVDGWERLTITHVFQTIAENDAKQTMNRIRARIRMTGSTMQARLNGPEVRRFGYSLVEV